MPFGEVLPLGDPPFNPEMAEHFWQSFATSAGITLHVTKKAGRNTHHVVEATFKGVARCLRDAVRIEGAGCRPPRGRCRGDTVVTLVAVLDYGIGNLRSAQKALQRVGADARLTADHGLIADAAGVVLPGVGAFGRCMESLHETGSPTSPSTPRATTARSSGSASGCRCSTSPRGVAGRRPASACCRARSSAALGR